MRVHWFEQVYHRIRQYTLVFLHSSSNYDSLLVLFLKENHQKMQSNNTLKLVEMDYVLLNCDDIDLDII